KAAIRDAGFRGTIVRAGHRTAGFFGPAGEARLAPRRALAFCGIGDPALFAADLAAEGVEVERLRAFRDHHAYTARQWLAARPEAEAIGAPIVTTEKALSRLEPIAGGTLLDAPLLVMRVEAIVWDEGPLLTAIRKAVA